MSSFMLQARPSFKRSHSDLSRSATPTSSDIDGNGLKEDLPAFLRQSQDEIKAKFAIIQSTDKRRIESFLEKDQDPDHPWAFDVSREARLRNRYSDVQPWSKARVHLKVQHGEPDYINASPISLTSTDGQRELQYIATQGPKQDGVNHFWQMVWHECRQTAVIVMLTQLSEGMREKCFQYYPSERDSSPNRPKTPLSRSPSRPVTPPNSNLAPPGTSPSCSGILSPGRLSTSSRHSNAEQSTATQPFMSITLTSTDGGAMPAALTLIDSHFDETSQATVRKLSLTCGNEARIIYHFLFSGWPDFGVPQGRNRSAMLALIRLSREKNDSGDIPSPRVVHCSAGVGRTGTFLALEHLIAELDLGAWDDWSEATQQSYVRKHAYKGHDFSEDEDENEDNTFGHLPDPIFDTVSLLREQRANMVQSISQFLFIYEILAEEWLKRLKKVTEERSLVAEPSPKAIRLGAGLKKMLSLGRDKSRDSWTSRMKTNSAGESSDSRVLYGGSAKLDID